MAKLEKAHAKYEMERQAMASMIMEYSDLDVGIEYQPSDGFVVEFESQNTPLDTCIDIIKEKGELSEEDYFENRI